MKFVKAKKDIGALEKRLWDAFWKTHGKKRSYQKLKYIIEEKSKDVGYIHLIISGGLMKVEDIIIEEQHRRKNIGNKIMGFIDRLAKKKKCHKIRLETSPDFMPRAFHLYKKYGFKKEASLRKDMHNRNWIIMSKPVK